MKLLSLFILITIVISNSCCSGSIDYVIKASCTRNKAINIEQRGRVTLKQITMKQPIITMDSRFDPIKKGEFNITLFSKESQRFLCFNKKWNLVGLKKETHRCHFVEVLQHGYSEFVSAVDENHKVKFNITKHSKNIKGHENWCERFFKIKLSEVDSIDSLNEHHKQRHMKHHNRMMNLENNWNQPNNRNHSNRSHNNNDKHNNKENLETKIVNINNNNNSSGNTTKKKSKKQNTNNVQAGPHQKHRHRHHHNHRHHLQAQSDEPYRTNEEKQVNNPIAGHSQIASLSALQISSSSTSLLSSLEEESHRENILMFDKDRAGAHSRSISTELKFNTNKNSDSSSYDDSNYDIDGTSIGTSSSHKKKIGIEGGNNYHNNNSNNRSRSSSSSSNSSNISNHRHNNGKKHIRTNRNSNNSRNSSNNPSSIKSNANRNLNRNCFFDCNNSHSNADTRTIQNNSRHRMEKIISQKKYEDIPSIISDSLNNSINIYNNTNINNISNTYLFDNILSNKKNINNNKNNGNNNDNDNKNVITNNANIQITQNIYHNYEMSMENVKNDIKLTPNLKEKKTTTTTTNNKNSRKDIVHRYFMKNFETTTTKTIKKDFDKLNKKRFIAKTKIYRYKVVFY